MQEKRKFAQTKNHINGYINCGECYQDLCQS